MKQSLHDEGGQSLAGKEGDAQKLDKVRVEECAYNVKVSCNGMACGPYVAELFVP